MTQSHWLEDDEVVDMPRVAREDRDDRVDYKPVREFNYETHFKFYWMVTAWVALGFQSLIMLVIIANLGLGTRYDTYQFLTHLSGTVAALLSMGALALIYRFLLFPPWPSTFVRAWPEVYGHQQPKQPATPPTPTPEPAKQAKPGNGTNLARLS